MRYLGGKSKIRKQVATFLESQRKPNQPYLEPFVGGGWILQEMTGERYASDGNVALIAMYQALQLGWEPPEFVSEDEWRQYRDMPEPVPDPMMAFARFGCGFGGDWMGGYARGVGRCFPKETHDNLMKQLPMIHDVRFTAGDYRQHSPKDMLVYCDPPYESTTAYGAFDGFDHVMFWETMRIWSRDNTVIVSEYQAPDDFLCVKEFASRMGLTTNKEKPVRVERLFMHQSYFPNWMWSKVGAG
jgi:DNA adenine methylase